MKQTKSYKGAVITLSIVLILMLAIGGYYIYKVKTDTKPVDNEPTNEVNTIIDNDIETNTLENIETNSSVE